MCHFITWLGQEDVPPTADQIVKQVPASVNHFDLPGYAGPGDSFVYENLGNITAPTLVLVGGQDLLLPLGDSQVLADRIPGASLIQFPDAGHAAILQHEYASARYIADFLDLVEQSS